MITRDQAQLLLTIDATVSDLAHTEQTWRENASYYAVIPDNPLANRNVIFVNKASGQLHHSPYADVQALLAVMRPVE